MGCFLIWFTVSFVLWTLANLPREIANGFISQAGFPWRFVSWRAGLLEWIDYPLLVIDIAIGLGLGLGVAALCAWRNNRGQRE